MTSKRQREKAREYVRRYYWRHHEQELERSRQFREDNPDYLQDWYEQNKTYQQAKVKLRNYCRPDLTKKWRFEKNYPGLDASDVEYPDDIAAECDRIYKKKLKKLRRLFGRDPDTGHRK
jgi:hypothetical protein